MGEASVGRDIQRGMQLVIADVQGKEYISDIQAREFQCRVCGKNFSRKFTLDAHMLIHRGEKPHMCQFCGKSFRQKGTLMRHKALHSSKNLFHCNLCNRGFRQKNVFIHHLRHRHNVSTETLDRRKYRTEPKDYQSIMDTLPPFVHADSTAIASTGKHFDALLSKSIQNSVADTSGFSQYNCVDENMINSTISALNNSGEISSRINETNQLNSIISIDSEVDIDKDYLEDVKPVFNNKGYEFNPSVSCIGNDVSGVTHATVSSMIVASSENSFCSQPNNVTSSNEVSDESIICFPCHRSFINESEFKCHMKTHVQSVLLGDVNSSNSASELNQHLSSGPTVSPNSVLSDGSSMLVSESRDEISQNQKVVHNFSNSCASPIKAEFFDYEIDDKLSPKKTNTEYPMPSSTTSKKEWSKNMKFFCPVCKTSLESEEAFKKHAREHDSYSLLKLCCEALGTNGQYFDQSSLSDFNFKSPSMIGNNNPDKSSQCKTQNVANQFRKDMIKSKLIKIKSPFQRFQCTQCKETFANKTLLEYHSQLHLSTKGFLCRCCKKTFSTKRLLLSHTRSNHFKTFSCPKCSRIFNYRKLFCLHKNKCIYNYNMEMSNGSQINFPVVSIESLLNSDMDGIVGIIPVRNPINVNGKNNVKLGIPVMSVTQIKALYQSTSSNLKL